MLGNGHRLGHEPHTESLPGIGLNIKDLGDAVPKSWFCAMLLTMVMMASSTVVTVLLLLVWLDHLELVGVCADSPASSASCWECWDALRCCDEGGWSAAMSSSSDGSSEGRSWYWGSQLASGPVVT